MREDLMAQLKLGGINQQGHANGQVVGVVTDKEGHASKRNEITSNPEHAGEQDKILLEEKLETRKRLPHFLMWKVRCQNFQGTTN